MNFESRQDRIKRVKNMTHEELLRNLLDALKNAHVKMGGELAPYLPDNVQLYYPHIEGKSNALRYELLWDAVLDIAMLSWYEDKIEKGKTDETPSENQQKK